LNNVANELAIGSSFEEALNLAQEAEAIFAKLAADRPGAFAERHARTLNSLSNRLNDLQHTVEAIEASQKAVAIFRELASENPSAFQQPLGMALHSLAYRFFEQGDTRRSLEAIDEAIVIRQHLLLTTPSASRVALAMSSAVRASALRKAGRIEEALAEIRRSVQMLTIAAGDLGASISREAREIGGRARNWHNEANEPLPPDFLLTLGQLTSVDEFGTTS
jgi:tetratricopeptide (TPR) repeat protein